jgi:large subunit ribosomal protein L10
MPVGRTEKGTTITELKGLLGDAHAAVLTDFRGMTVAEMTELRGLLRKHAVQYRVVKNTLARIAVQDGTLRELSPYLEGPTAVAVSRKDPVAPAKVLAGWARGREKFKIKGGVVEGRIVSAADVMALADLPPREVLLGRVAGVLQAPIQGLVTVLSASLRGLAVALNQVREQREKQGTAPAS